MCTLRSAAPLSLVLLGMSVAALHAQPAPISLDTRWGDLLSPDESKATRALLALAATPKETTEYLQSRLKPVKADPKRIQQLLKALDSDTYTIRNQASSELEYYGKYIKSDLESALKPGIKLETKARIDQLLDKLPKPPKKEEPPKPLQARPGSSISVSNINGNIQILIDGQPLDFAKMSAPPPPPPPGPPQGWVRATRVVTLLEHLNTPEARALLQSLAGGEPDALPTIAAREALERLQKDK